MNILSLFDWMSCWQQAIINLWIKDYTYFASEIDKFAIKVTQENFPNTIQIWDVKNIHSWLKECTCDKKKKTNFFLNTNIDLLLWWSPCQWFSFAWKQLNFEDERSKLFFEYVRILKEVKPKYFLLENVKMKKEYQDIISEHLFWIQPTIINSSLLTAQNRVRLYWVWELQKDWTYKRVEIEQPQDKWVLLKDILEDEVDKKYYLDDKHIERIKSRTATQKPLERILWDENKSHCLTVRWAGEDHSWMILYKNIRINDFSNFNQDNVFLWKDDKAPTLTAWDWWLRPKTYSSWIRKLTPIECERLQWVKDWYTSCVSNSQRYKMLWNWWTIPVIEHILKNFIFNNS